MLTPALEAAQDAFEHGVRLVYVSIAHEASWPLQTCAEYLEELAALYQLRPNEVGAWALTLEQSLGEACPPKVRQALTHLAHSSAILAALEATGEVFT
jgi:hypothetical protein